MALVLVCGGAPSLADERLTPQQLDARLVYKTGKVEVGDGLATIDLGSGFRFLDPEQTERVLVEGWGNPPGNKTLGMIVPSAHSPLADQGWGAILTFDEDGYVDDDGAETIDYAKLLKEMQEAAEKENPDRVKQGYEAVRLVGWAEPPHYDKASHKIYWAKDLQFGEGGRTLNYNIQVLGRRGVLVLNAVAGIDQLPTIRASMQELLPAVTFQEGHRYTDYLPGKDKAASYGVAALVAGTLAAKTGLFKGLLAGLLAFKKGIIVGVAALGAYVRKRFRRDRDESDTA
jgi:uncharacterized membrane-anchored protein